MSSQPAPRDIVVRHGLRDGRQLFVLSTAPGPDQLVFHTEAEAIRHAANTARREAVRVWVTTGDSQFTLVHDFSIDVESV